MSMGSIARGNRKILKRERATKALSAVSCSSGLFRLARENVPNVTTATCITPQIIRGPNILPEASEMNQLL